MIAGRCWGEILEAASTNAADLTPTKFFLVGKYG
jgi:hypothetical protein